MKKIFVLTVLFLFVLTSSSLANNSTNFNFKDGFGGISKLTKSDARSMQNNLENIISTLSKELNNQKTNGKREYKLKEDNKKQYQNPSLENIKKMTGLSQKELENIKSEDITRYLKREGINLQSLIEDFNNRIIEFK